MAQDVNVYFVPKVVPAYAPEEVRPVVIELQIIYLGVVLKEATVVPLLKVEIWVSSVDGLK